VRLVSFNLGSLGSGLPSFTKYLQNKAHVNTRAKALSLVKDS